MHDVNLLRAKFDVPNGPFNLSVWSFEPLVCLRRSGTRAVAREAVRNGLHALLRNRAEITRADLVSIVEDEMAWADRIASMQPAADTS